MSMHRSCLVMVIWGMFLVMVSACASSTEEAMDRDRAASKDWDPEGEVLPSKQFDLNQDGKTDVWKYYIPKMTAGSATPELKVARKELDLNYDGKVDVKILLDENGQVAIEKYDLDFDGKIDRIDTLKPGLKTEKEMQVNYDRMQELDFQFDEQPDVFKYYQNDQLVWKESDANGDGRVDHWERFVNGEMTHYGDDIDGDGRIDEWRKNYQKRQAKPEPEPEPVDSFEEEEEELPEPGNEDEAEQSVEEAQDEAGDAMQEQKEAAEQAADEAEAEQEPASESETE